MPDFLPSTDAGLLAWANQFSTKLTATPTAYGVTAANATSLAALLSTYSTALAAAVNPATRGKSTVFAKSTARKALAAYCRVLAKQIQGTATVTNQQRSDLGLTVPVMPAPIPPPANSPDIDIVSVVAWTVKVRLHDSASGTRRGKPPGVAGASVFSFIGATPPATIAEWKFEGSTTRPVFDILFDPSTAPGAKVWLTAFWFNPRSESGPAASPITTNLQGGGATVAA